jgi:hypothetical protein
MIFGRPEAQRCADWYGSVADVCSGKCRLSRWEVLNLARVYLDPRLQHGNVWCTPELLPGFIDRKGIWHSRAASYIIEQSLALIVFDFLMLRPPVWVEEPFAIQDVLSYCNTHLHKGTLYHAAYFRLVRINPSGIATYARAVRPLTQSEQAQIVRRSQESERCRRLRSQSKQSITAAVCQRSCHVSPLRICCGARR